MSKGEKAGFLVRSKDGTIVVKLTHLLPGGDYEGIVVAGSEHLINSIKYIRDLKKWDVIYQPPALTELVCVIERSNFGYLMIVDGEDVYFESESNVEYFTKHYAGLGYKTIVRMD
jgi:hypothetical protein